MTSAHITLLVEDLQALVRAADPKQRYPALEQVLAKGRAQQRVCATANHFRLSLFGLDPENDFPIAALAGLSDGTISKSDKKYWLRADPVTMRSDMAQVYLTSYGFADIDADERTAIERCIFDVLSEERMDVAQSPLGHWYLSLNSPPDFQFTSLDQALGMDVAEALPGHREARDWRRILNETQIALHNCPVNIRRRQSGLQEVNSVWFWGGGNLPEPSEENTMGSVHANQPVTRGLAILNNCQMETVEQAAIDEVASGAGQGLIDWLPDSGSAPVELDKLEKLVQELLHQVKNSALAFTLFDGNGRGWRFDRITRLCFWRRPAPLANLLASSI